MRISFRTFFCNFTCLHCLDRKRTYKPRERFFFQVFSDTASELSAMRIEHACTPNHRAVDVVHISQTDREFSVRCPASISGTHTRMILFRRFVRCAVLKTIAG